MSKTAAHITTPTPATNGGHEGAKSPVSSEQASYQRNLFFSMALNMSWQLAVVVLIPVIGGVWLDKAFNTSHLFTFIGLGVALLGCIAVMWRTMQVANRLPVPKLSAAQKRQIQKSYEDEDKENDE